MGRSGSQKPAWKVAGYAAQELIGYGASSQVWRGRVLRTGAPVALKVLELTDAAAQRSARAEAALLSALDHPHLLRLHELVSDGDHAILVLDFAAGGSLGELLERRSRISVGELVTVLSPVAAAVSYLHDEGLVHGDISPANVLFTAQGQPLLADLGVARMAGSSDESRSTLAYLDPAVANGGAPGSPSDVFMLAATSLHALVGRPPWVASTAHGLVDTAALGDIAGLDDLLAGVPENVAAIVRRGLSALPYARGTAADFALDLRHAATPVPVELTAGRLRVICAELDVVDDSIDEAPADNLKHSDSSQTSTDKSGSTSSADDLGPTGTAAGSVYRPRHSSMPPINSAAARRSNSRVGRVRSSGAAASGGKSVDAEVVLERPDFARPHFRQSATEDGSARSLRSDDGLSTSTNNAGVDGAGHAAGLSDDGATDLTAMSLTHQVRPRIRPPAPPPPRFGRVWHSKTESPWRSEMPSKGGFPREGLRLVPVSRKAVLTAAGVVTGVLASAGVAGAVAVGWHPPGIGGVASAGTSLPHHATASAAPGLGSAVTSARSTTAHRSAPASSAPTPAATTTTPTAPPNSFGSKSVSTSTAAPRSTAEPTSTPEPTSTAAPTSTPAPAGSPTSKRSAGTSAGTTPVPKASSTSTPRTTSEWQAVLAALDAHRENAFATNRPDELAQVYVAGTLRNQDAAMLRRTVAPGCALSGLRTMYRVRRARSDGPGATVLDASASLSSAVLACPPTTRQHTAPIPATDLTIRLVATNAGYRIAGLQQSAPR